jgi:hypothetical protein
MAFDTTQVTFAELLDHGLRRCRINPASQTSELIATAQSGIWFALIGLANRGLNLWRTTRSLIGVTPGVSKYALPAGTIRLPAVNYISNFVAPGTINPIVGGYTFVLTDAAPAQRIGIFPYTDFIAALTLTGSADGTTFDNVLVVESATYLANNWYWFDLPKYETLAAFNVESVTTFVLLDGAVSTQTSTLPMSQFNINEWAQQTYKSQASRPATNFYFERTIRPAIYLWPNLSSATTYDMLEIWSHTNIDKITSMTEPIDVPQHWLDAVCWLVAREMCAVMPGVSSDVAQLVFSECDKSVDTAECGESDGSILFLSPNIAPYYRV